METLKHTMERIHSWPEGARRLFAMFFFAVFGVFIFIGWGSATSGRLANLSDETSGSFFAAGQIPQLPAELMAGLPEEGRAIVSPLAGISESMRSVLELFVSKEENIRQAAPEDQTAPSWGDRISLWTGSVREYASIAVSGFSERTADILQPFLSGEGGAF